jgi:trimethylamine--corrinoid protein Co-methyltransferase
VHAADKKLPDDLKMFRFEILTKDNLECIYGQVLSILENVGVRFEHEEAVEFLSENGAVIAKNRNVKFPPSLVREALKSVPNSFSFYGRDSKSTRLTFGGQRTYFTTGATTGGKLLDLTTGQRRPSTLKDAEQIVRIDDALDVYDMVGAPTRPSDVPIALSQIETARVLIKNTSKPIYYQDILDLTDVTYILDMAAATLGGYEELRKRPFMHPSASCTSPLIWHKDAIDVLTHSAQTGVPTRVVSAPICGMTGPITAGGMLVLMFVEMLSALVYLQLLCKGLAMSLAPTPIMADYREGNCNVFSPTRTLITAASVELGRYLGVPTNASVGMTDSKIPSVQAGYEKAISTLFLLAAQSQTVGPFGNLDDWGTTSAELHVIDAEIVETIREVLKGFSITPETLSADIIRTVGPGKSYLTLTHTRKHFPLEHWLPEISFKGSWKLLERLGGNVFLDNARKKVTRILDTHIPTPIGDIAAVDRIVEKAHRTVAK